MTTVSSTKASSLLGISDSRVRQLLGEGRIAGAYKEGRFWRIPLFKGMPKIISGKRGPKGHWRMRMQKVLTCIHVNKHQIARNRREQQQHPVIVVRAGSHLKYCHEVEIKGNCRLVYRPEQPLMCSGAVLWIEVEPSVEIVTKTFVQNPYLS
ncbi:DNA-binding protein [Calothrix sp. NIES-3974]|uniref:DNA-binding protein n=1 Tax=Calothrix sp. NIES-3974 TaxID=2005462 RepID=UPI000B5FB20C|nr:DNA-binding protein [Calothrix sp. NIES-3974]BAZ04305.1 hypothetical protein NIES3974_09380 [Calothrix sp. NIES-3974]